MNKTEGIVLRDKNGKNWGVSVFHGDYPQLYTHEVDEIGLDFVIIHSFSDKFKIKVGIDGRLYTYPVDDLG